MILIAHILIGIISLLYSIYTAFNPSSKSFSRIYALTTGTLISGIATVATAPSSFGRFCISGAAFIGIIAVCLFFGKRSLSYSR